MKLLLLTSLTMMAFAANSVLNRLALADGAAGAASFAAIRLISGAAILMLIVWIRRRPAIAARGVGGPLSLGLYMVGFSYAYLSLDAGIGALILFGGVQVTMFAGALYRGEAVPFRRWLGAGLAFAGLAYLMWPSAGAEVPLIGAALMLLGALGWGLYSLLGAGARDPLALNARNFAWVAPFGAALFLAMPDAISPYGAGLAIVAGAVTSGLGYALWYHILPHIPATVAAVAQLTVPIIAAVGGFVFLGESISQRFIIAAALVLGGVLISVYRTRGSRAS